MPYIGNPPAEKYASYDVQHITTSATSSYVLDKNVANENEIRVVLNNIIQQPGSSYAYTASGNTLTLSAATTSSDKLYVVFTGKAVQTVTPPPSSVGLAQFNATGSPGTNTFLRGDNSWATPSDTSLTLNNNGANKIIAGTATTNTMSGQAKLTFDGTTLINTQDAGAASEIRASAATVYTKIIADDASGFSAIDYSNDLRFKDAGTEKMRIDTNGDVAIGTTSTTHRLVVNDTTDFIPGSSNVANTAPLNVRSSASSGNIGAISLGGNDNAAIYNTSGSNLAIQSYSYLDFLVSQTNDDKIGTKTQRMRIDYNGNILFGKTDTSFNSDGGMITEGGQQIKLTRDGDEVCFASNFINTNGYPAAFHYSGSTVGTIRSTNNSTSYNTSSDYRLKENEVVISDGITRLKTLKPYRFNFKNDVDEDGNVTRTVDGFFAHEVTAVPEAISGEKDAMHPEVLYTADDELPDGKNIGDVKEATKINPQSIDQSKLVPLLTSALQEAITKIETLETKVTALENA